MTTANIKKTAEILEQDIARAEPAARLALQPQFSQALFRMAAHGERVPVRMRSLDARLMDEAIEARFDNMPV
ncbi:hypothetical protein I5535_17795 [Rhodobacteraceae bacterium F11138]|nr:hypothetical protein [Rhodobacteraceae bacterium F11138]